VTGKRSSKVSFSGNEDENTRARLGGYPTPPYNKDLGDESNVKREIEEDAEDALKAAPLPQPPVNQVEQVESVVDGTSCKSCGNSGTDFLGNPCSCEAGKQKQSQVEEPTPSAVETQPIRPSPREGATRSRTAIVTEVPTDLGENVEETKKEAQDEQREKETKEDAKDEQQEKETKEEAQDEPQEKETNEEAKDEQQEKEVLPTGQQQDQTQDDDIDPDDQTQEYKDDFEADATLDSNNLTKALPEDNSVEDEFESSKDA